MKTIVHRHFLDPGMPPSSPASPRDQHTRKAHRMVLDVAYLQGPAG